MSDDARRVREELERLAGEVAELRAAQDWLVKVLIARKDLGPGHERLIGRVRAAEVAASRPRVRLGVLRDKYQLAGADIDCAARLHLCKARCCSYTIELTAQDIEEGGVKWDIERPYLIRREADGYCTHLDRATGGCGCYERRPATCREYDCRSDRRVWIDFEQRIPAPMPGDLTGRSFGSDPSGR